MGKFANWCMGTTIVSFGIVALTFIVLYALSELKDIHLISSLGFNSGNNNQFMGMLSKPGLFLKSFFAKKGHEMFDHVFYTNLDSRTDRRYQIECELQRIGFSQTKISRNPGIIDKFGALGCAKAILNALLKFESESSWQICLFVEDDLVFVESAAFVNDQLLKFSQLHIEWDVLMLSSNTIKYKSTTNIDFLVKIIDAQTTAAFAVHRNFLPTLIANVTEGISQLEQSNKQSFCIDIYWKSLQPLNNFFTFHPLIAHQRDSFSDIENRFISSYDDKKPLKMKLKKIKYLFCVLISKEEDLQKKKLQDFYHDEIDYLYYYADEDLKEDLYSYNQQTKVLRIKTDASYLGQCQLLSMLFKYISLFIGLSESLQSNLKGVILMNDAFKINDNASIMFHLLESKSDYESTWGLNNISDSPPISFEIVEKCKVDQKFQHLIQSRCPQLEFLPVKIGDVSSYFKTDFLFLSTNSIMRLSHLDSFFKPLPKSTQLQFHLSKNKQYYENLCIFEDVQIALALK